MKHEQVNFKMETFNGIPASNWGELYGFEAIKDYPYNPENKNHWAGKDKNGNDTFVDTPTLLRAYLRTSIVAEAGDEFVEEIVAHGTKYVEEFFEKNKPSDRYKEQI